MKVLTLLFVGLLLSMHAFAKIPELYESQLDLSLEDLVIEVNGYKVPTMDAFRGWMLINEARDRVLEMRDYFIKKGVRGDLPLYLVLLQGTDWKLNKKSVFVLPARKHWDNMMRTLHLVESEVIPVLGDIVPVSGERSEEYNVISGGANKSKHLNFCALDLVPEKTMNRKELYKKLQEIYLKVGKKYNMGLGLYSDLRFHIDTCGYRQW